MDKNRFVHVKGILKETILNEIKAQGQLHGYALICAIRTRLGVYLGASTIYPALKLLQKEGFIKGAWNVPIEGSLRPRYLYSLTPRGERELEALTCDLKFLLQAAVLM